MPLRSARSARPRTRWRPRRSPLAVLAALAVVGSLVVPTAGVAVAAGGTGSSKIWTPPNTTLSKTASVPGKSVPGHPAAAPASAPMWTPPKTAPARPHGQADIVLPAPARSGAAAPQAKSAAAAQAAPAAGAAVQAGSLPVWLTPSAPAAAARVSAQAAPTTEAAAVPITVSVADDRTATAAGTPDGLLTLTPKSASAATSTQLSLDAGRFGAGTGGDWAQRATLVKLPACALTTPQAKGCQQRTPVPSHYDAATKRLVADVQLPAGTAAGGAQPKAQSLAAAPQAAADALVLGVVSSSSSGAGTYAASSLAPSQAWASGNSAGSFTYNYPLQLPPTIGGSAPQVALSYDSSSVDGKTSSTNSQASWIGDGWDYSPGFIERSYRPCNKDGITNSGDQCWAGANGTLSLGGHSGQLVPDDASCQNASGNDEQSHCTWHLQGDDGTKVQFLTGATNGTWNGSYAKVTDTTGTVYYFGLNHLPDANGNPTTIGAATGSAFTEPVFSPNSGDPCYDATKGQASWCQSAWRWNLDFVVDAHSNLISYAYTPEANYYALGGGQNNGTGSNQSYTRAGVLASISYGQRLSDQLGANGGYQAAAKVVFNSGERCVTSTAACDPGQRTTANAANWPDVPMDEQCLSQAGSCNQYGPSFWSSKWLNSITTEVESGGSYRQVDTYTLDHSFLNDQNGSDNAQIPWLTDIKRQAQDNQSGQSAINLPQVSFTSVLLPNRVDGYSLSRPDFYRPRISLITTETGGSIGVDYDGSHPACSRVNGPQPPPADQDTVGCYNVKWYPPNSTATTVPTDDWFLRYPVKTVTVDPKSNLIQGSLPQVTTYTYGKAAWHRNDAQFVADQDRTWDQFRGYASVTVQTGSGADGPIAQTSTSYYQGMNGDITTTGPRTSTVAGPMSGQVSDDDWLAGQVLETDNYAKAGDPAPDEYTVNTSSGPVTTATHNRAGWTPLIARYAATSTVSVTKKQKTDGSLQTTGSTVTSDPANGNRPVTSLQTADGLPDVCTRTSYAVGGNPQMTSLPSDVLTVSGASACSATPTAANTSAWTRNLYDGQPFGQALATGDNTGTQLIDHYDGSGNPQFTTTATSTYDAYGRAATATDPNSTDSAHPNGAVTTTVYGSANPGELPNSVSVTSPAPAGASDAATGRTTSKTLDIARGLPLTTTDPNGRTVTEAYDALGRLSKVWLAGRTTSQNPDYNYAYALNGSSAPSTVATSTLRSDGATSTVYSTSVEILDGLGRTVQTQETPGMSSYTGRMITDTYYDSQGRVGRTDASYYNNDSGPSTTWFMPSTDKVPAQTYTQYDGQGRPTSSQLLAYGSPQATTTTVYPGAERTDVSPQGATPTSTVTDARGRTAQLWQYHTTTATGHQSDADTTTYSYTPSGQAAGRVDAAGNTWSYGYDLRGRQISSTDPDSGTSTTTFDTDSRPASTTDARGQSLAYAYDLLGRKTGEFNGTTAGDPTKQLAAWTYDTVAKGQPASSTRYVGGTSGSAYSSTVTAMDTAYRPTSTTVSIPGSEVNQTSPYTYTHQATYDPLTGALSADSRSQVGDQAAETVNYTYDVDGPLDNFGTSNTTYDVSSDYDAYGRNLRSTLNPWGTQIVETNAYDETTGRLLTQFVDKQTARTGTVQQTAYAYNQAGLVTAITSIPDNVPAATDRQCFSYDYLDRLTTAWSDTGGVNMAAMPTVGGIGSCANASPTSGAQAPSRTTVGGPAAYWQSYSYDLTGNRTQLVQHDTNGDSTKDQTTTQTFGAPGVANTPTGAADTGGGTGGPHALLTSQDSSNGVTSSGGSDQYDADGNTTKITNPLGTRNLLGGTVIASGQSITSNSMRLSMQGDGNLVLVSLRTGAVVWKTGTNNHPGAWATMQTDGNFVVYDTNHNPLWSTVTYGNAGAYIAVQDDGNFVLYKSAQAVNQNPLWNSGTWNSTDAAGGATLTWDAEGKLGSVTQGGATTTYVYDADGNQLVRRDPDKTVITLGSDELTYTTATKSLSGTRYYSIPGEVTLVRQGNSAVYEFADNHGTDTLAIDANSLAETRNPVDPFGNPRATSTATNNWAGDHGFVGGTKDTTTGLTNLGAREYQSATGRFVGVDPLLDSSNPQQWNGYAYSNNDPVNLSDPSGRMYPAEDGIAGWCDTWCKYQQTSPNVGRPGGSFLDLAAGFVSGVVSGLDPTGQLHKPLDWLAKKVGVHQNTDGYHSGGVIGGVTSFFGAPEDAGGNFAKKKGLRLVAKLWGDENDVKDATKANDAAKALTGSCPRSHSFVAGTEVLMADGSTKKIEDVKVGDRVADAPGGGSRTESHVVDQVHVTTTDRDFTDITVGTPDGLHVITSTSNHPYYDVTAHTWQNAGDLRPGDLLQTPDGGTATVMATRSYTDPQITYDLTVDDVHTYYVLAGITPVLVHNSLCGGGLGVLKNWSSQRFQFGNQNFLLDRSGMTHILERHHPTYWDGSVKAQQSFFDPKMSVSDIQDAIGSVMQQNRDTLISRGSRGMYQIRGSLNGTNYVLGLNNGRVGQFYPVKG
ncbi:RHS repeat-associated protein [Kitasatospora sp. MAP12-15]|uniref:RHS repeat-associated core domain-containing protein n=1 Tax=unclassified Kitasatospora TaxID=2633591 RepID=UPI00247346DF|nr:RHS repeat-associated core domain-containing protein [Kitasatospora sp. MAP12-44]MDH6113512.1 RHS repeat-associated protein [Kitasatospora sp. MAP12-44]